MHVGGSFSSVEVDCLQHDKKQNDKFILSKGHAGIIQYVVLNQLVIACQKNGYIGVHPDYGKAGASTGSWSWLELLQEWRCQKETKITIIS